MSEEESIQQTLKTAWHRFIDETAVFRPDLYKYARRLTGNVWDAEDLVQDTLTRAYGRWGMTIPPISNPRSYLMRIAANVWIDQMRRTQEMIGLDGIPENTASDLDPVELREAGQLLLQALSPQEQAAVIMRETFDMTAPEIAEVIGTTPGAVKTALHRGRQRLASSGHSIRKEAPDPELVEKFVELFHARDLEGLAQLFASSATAENIGNSWHIGDGPRGYRGVLFGCLDGHQDWPEQHRREHSGLKIAEYQGELILLAMSLRDGEAGIGSVFRIDVADNLITRFRSYGFCQEMLAEIAADLGERHHRTTYRAPTPAPGKDWD